MNKGICALALTCLISLAQHASATLVDNGTFFSDDASGLDWLELTQTTGLSANDILGGAGGFVNNGYRYATEAELTNLYLSNGVTTISGGWGYNGQYAVGQLFISLFGNTCPSGCIGSPHPGDGYTTGLYGNYDTNGALVSMGVSTIGAAYVFGTNPDGLFSINPPGYNLNYKFYRIGNFLVRDTGWTSAPVPAPATLSLMAVALGLLALRRARA